MNLAVSFQCPANIALVKYWGKKETGIQLPANPSISLTLGDLYATTTLVLKNRIVNDIVGLSFVFTLEGKKQPTFDSKIAHFLLAIAEDCTWLSEYTLHIDSYNNFPHGTGIASSAAGFGALGLCIAKAEQLLLNGSGDANFNPLPESSDLVQSDRKSLKTAMPESEVFMQRSSYLARKGSGSAARSMFSLPAVWGETSAVGGSSDLFAVPLVSPIHKDLQDWGDVVLIVDETEKAVSSSAGHALLKNHPFAAARFQQAQSNLTSIVHALNDGDVAKFIEIVESEALQLHSMMMTSIPYYILMRPNTLSIIERIWQFREETRLPLCFTLDAGANVHLLFDRKIDETVMNFVHNTLLYYCKKGQYLCSVLGVAPHQIHV